MLLLLLLVARYGDLAVSTRKMEEAAQVYHRDNLLSDTSQIIIQENILVRQSTNKITILGHIYAQDSL